MFKELLKDAMPFIESAAPTIATSLGGPMAGTIVQLLERVFNAEAKNPQDLMNKILQDPNAKEKLKACDHFCSVEHGNIVTLWHALGKPSKLNIEWCDKDE